MSTALEGRYRAALRWYPRSWRVANADAIVGTMLDHAEAEGRTAPLPGELRNLASSGVAERLESFAPQRVRDRVAAIALAIGTAYALIMIVASEWAPFAETGPLNGWMFAPDDTRFREFETQGFGPFASVLVIVYGMWITGFLLVLLRLSKTAIAVLLLTIPLLGWIRTLRFDDIGALQPTTPALLLIALLAILACIGRSARVGRKMVAALVLAAVILVTILLFANGHPPIYEGRLSAIAGTFSILHAPGYSLALVVAGIALVIRRQRAWAAASFISAAPWLLLVPLYVLPYAISTMVIAGLLALLALAAGLVVWKRAVPTAPSSRSS